MFKNLDPNLLKVVNRIKIRQNEKPKHGLRVLFAQSNRLVYWNEN